MLIDTHTHINDKRLISEAEEIVKQMERDNLSHIINVSYDRKSVQDSLALSKKYEKVFAAAGYHPHDAKDIKEEDFEYLKVAAKEEKVVAIGEIGLDYHYDFSPRDVQKEVFVRQIKIADELKLPIIIHLRDAYEDMYQIMSENKRYLNSGILMHCYQGSAEMLKRFLSFNDIYFAYGGSITFKNAKKEKVILSTPLDRLVVETDCPYMTPEPYRGKTNYPKYVNKVAEKLKEILPGVDIEKVTTENAMRLFKRLK